MTYSRREFGLLALGGLAATTARAKEVRYGGVRIGIGTYSFRGTTLDDVLRFTTAAGSPNIELESQFVEPSLPGKRDELRQWRLDKGVDVATAVRKKLDAAGIQVYAYNLGINDTFSDDEIDRVMLMTKALGSPVLNSVANLVAAKRIAPFVEKHNLILGLHPGGNPSDPNSTGTGDSWRKAFEISPRIHACPDLYQFRSWGPDPLAFLREIHARVTSLHFHDRKGQAWVPLGEGDMPTREVLLQAKKEEYKFPLSVERIYTVPDIDHAAEIRKGFDYCKSVLEG